MNKDGGPVFPLTGAFDNGMTLRDYFAAKAMVVLTTDGRGLSNADDWLPEQAYALADAMLQERKK